MAVHTRYTLCCAETGQQIVYGTECSSKTGPGSVKIGRGFRQGFCLSPILFKLQSEYLTKETVEEFGDFKIGQLIE